MARGNRRPKLTTKEELIEYLEENKDTELPFCEEIWQVAVDKTADKDRQFKEISTTDFEGNTKTKKIPNGAVNPVSKYFQLIALPNFRKIAEAKLEDDIEEDEDNDDIEKMLEEMEDNDENSFIKELVSIYFASVNGDDLQFVIDRFSDYYTNYEFNEGSDKFLVVSAVSDELTLRELYGKRIKGNDNESKIEKVKKGYLSTLESLKVLKKQGGKLDEGKNKFTMFLDELEKAGELKIQAPDIADDKIGALVTAFRQSIMRAFREG